VEDGLPEIERAAPAAFRGLGRKRSHLASAEMVRGELERSSTAMRLAACRLIQSLLRPRHNYALYSPKGGGVGEGGRGPGLGSGGVGSGGSGTGPGGGWPGKGDGVGRGGAGNSGGNGLGVSCPMNFIFKSSNLLVGTGVLHV
jgi:hypothetical protein